MLYFLSKKSSIKYAGVNSLELAPKQWALFALLLDQEADGSTRDEIRDTVWKGRKIDETSLDQLKAATNNRIENLGLEIVANQRGVWKIDDLKSTS